MEAPLKGAKTVGGLATGTQPEVPSRPRRFGVWWQTGIEPRDIIMVVFPQRIYVHIDFLPCSARHIGL